MARTTEARRQRYITLLGRKARQLEAGAASDHNKDRAAEDAETAAAIRWAMAEASGGASS